MLAMAVVSECGVAPSLGKTDDHGNTNIYTWPTNLTDRPENPTVRIPSTETLRCNANKGRDANLMYPESRDKVDIGEKLRRKGLLKRSQPDVVMEERLPSTAAEDPGPHVYVPPCITA
jgi:hypothetical protein